MRTLAGCLVIAAATLGMAGARPSATLKSFARDVSAQLAVAKPASVSIVLLPRADVTVPGATTTADLSVRANAPTGPLHISLAATGSASLPGATSIDLPALAAGADASVPVPYTVSSAGAGELRATVTGGAAAVVYTLGSGDEALHGRSGPLDLRLEQLDHKHANGKLDDASYTAAVQRTAGGGASEVASTQAAGPTATLSGIVRWTDRAGKTHPVRLAPLYVFSGFGTTTPLASTITGLDGSYSVTLAHPGSFFVQVFASSRGLLSVASMTGAVHYLVSFVHPVGPGRSLSLDLTANNVDDNNTAFSVADAILTAQLYVQRLRGAPLPKIVVYFPSPYGTFFVPDGSYIELLRLDRFDWDVSMHEFGHYFAINLGIDQGIHLPHGPGNLSEFWGKHGGIAVAWNEAWATYFAISAQQAMGTAALGIPFVGDTRYSDTEDLDFDYDLETQTGGFASRPGFVILSNGEDDEISDQRILWDLLDTADDNGDSGVTLGDAAIVSVLESSHATTLSEAYAAVVAGRSPADLAQIGCIFTEHRVAPTPTAPADGAQINSQPPTFAWSANGGGPSFRNNSFVVELYDASFTRLLLVSPSQSATSFTPTRAQWRSVVGAAGGRVKWLVRGSQLNQPVTGPYASCSSTIAVG